MLFTHIVVFFLPSGVFQIINTILGMAELILFFNSINLTINKHESEWPFSWAYAIYNWVNDSLTNWTGFLVSIALVVII